jgi:hypothetical protein
MVLEKFVDVFMIMFIFHNSFEVIEVMVCGFFVVVVGAINLSSKEILCLKISFVSCNRITSPFKCS